MREMNLEPSQKPSTNTSVDYKVYTARWWMVASVVIINISAASHLAAFPSVSLKAAKHYDQSGEMIDLLPTTSHGFRTLGLIITVFVAKKFGLRVFITVAGSLTFTGKISVNLLINGPFSV